MVYEMRLIVRTDAPPQRLVSEIAGNLESEGIGMVLSGCVYSGNKCIYDHKREEQDDSSHHAK